MKPIERPYTLDEVLQNEEVRAYLPRIDLDTITFEFGSSTIGTDQMQSLGGLGQAMEQVSAENPDEVYLIEGHTDAVGSDDDNLILSDERAEAVAVALSQNFDIPPENLVTEGYGEQYLKVPTEGPERRNRRVTVRRITPLLAKGDDQAQDEQDDQPARRRDRKNHPNPGPGPGFFSPQSRALRRSCPDEIQSRLRRRTASSVLILIGRQSE